MQFISDAPLYKLVRVTGPQHNLLVLRLSEAPIEHPTSVEALDAGRACANPISAIEVLNSVVRAIDDCAGEYGKQYFLEAVQYMAGDSRPVDVYYQMTKEIIRRIESSSP